MSFKLPPNLFRLLPILLSCFLSVMRVAAAPSIATAFDIPEGAAETTLKALTEQSGAQILYSPDLVAGIQTHAVKGTMSCGDALAVMLAHTGLIGVYDPKDGGYTIQPAAVPQKRSQNGNRQVSTAAAVNPSRREGDEMVILSAFSVKGNSQDDRYFPTESTSGGRVRVNIFDSSQNVAVISSAVIGDVAAGRVLDAMKYIPGVSESSIPNGLDRMNIRGFLTTSRTLDGITTQYSDSQGNIDPFIVERMEIVKGPNAILAPAANPGGTVNNISKKPVFSDFGQMAVDLNQYGGARAELDVNQMVTADGKLSFRVLAAVDDDKDYFKETTNERLVAPMATYRFSETTALTWQMHYVDNRISNYYDGISIDPTASSTNRAVLYQGVPRNLNIYGPDSYRNDGRVENTALFLTRVANLIDVRALYRHSNEYNENNSMTTLAGAASAAGINANSYVPATGLYTPGIVYTTAAPYTASPVAISPTFNRSGSRIALASQHDSVQVDLTNDLETKVFTATSLVGYAYNYDRGYYFGNALTAPAVTLTNFAYSPDVVGAINRSQQYYSSNNQVYASEKLAFFSDRLIFDGSYTRDYWSILIDDQVQQKAVSLSPSVGLASYGVVAKPIEDISFFYTHSQDSAILPVANLATAPSLPLQYGVQDEEGVRFLLPNKRVRLTVSHYQIVQNNTNVSNPANFAFPPPVPALPGLLTNRVARGWEFEAEGAITSNLSIVGGYTNFKNRNPFGQLFRGVAERTASALLNYSFARHSLFEGLSLTLGADYMCKRAGDDATGFTALGVPHQTSFFLPARTLVNAGINYTFAKHWLAQLNIDNLLNRSYLESDLARGTVWPGEPANWRLKFTYKL